MLQSLVRHWQPWQQQLAAADCKQLASLVTTRHDQLAQAQYLTAVGQHGATSLLDVVLMPAAEFSAAWPGYAAWLSGGGV